MKKFKTSDLVSAELPQRTLAPLLPFTQLTPSSDSLPLSDPQPLSLEKTITELLQSQQKTYAQKAKENIVLAQFDCKMRRIKAIKSKKYRRIRRLEKMKHEIIEDEDSPKNEVIERIQKRVPKNLLNRIEPPCEEIDSNIYEFKNCIESKKKHELGESNQPEDNLISKMFKTEFLKEKNKIEQEDAPEDEKIVLPGWNLWGGVNIEVKETKYNTIVKRKDGVREEERMDAGRSHVIFSEGVKGIENKFRASVPYGYTDEEYLERMEVPTGKMVCTSKVCKKQVKDNFFIYKSKHKEK